MLRNPIFGDFLGGGGGRTPCLPLPLLSAHELSPFMGLHENSPIRDIKLLGYTVTKTEIYVAGYGFV